MTIDDKSPRLTRREVFQGINAGLVMLGAAGIAAPAAGVSAAAPVAGPGMGPRKVREIENLWIPMADGTRIAARMWLPEDAETSPVPALIEYIPYRKRDMTRLWDEPHHSYFASHGYACIRPDIRGSGDSEGAVGDEYIRQEQDDAVEIVAWLARQPWGTGKVGMFGLSWGGFSALQVAARRPPALKAIITHCASDDRYLDDMHYSGGCINDGMFIWGSHLTMNGLTPPDPEIVGPRWREMWRKRLDTIDFFVGDWLAHQRRDDFWKHGSVSEDYAQIQCAVYAVGGWTDPYHRAIPRMLAGLKSPRKGLVGPWNHHFPYAAWPGPRIDWLAEATRWWDYWLKDVDNGIMREPMYRVWMPDVPTTHGTTEVSGRWVAEQQWPSPRIRAARYHLTAAGLSNTAESRGASAMVLTPLQTVGIASPSWFAPGPTDLADDQRIDDARSLVFDSAPLEQSVEILGAPVAHLEVSVDKPVAFLIVRLCEVEPGGASRRVTYGVLNLCHREGHEHPSPLQPGTSYRISLPMLDIAHRFRQGSRIRLAVSTTCWPLIWPSPEPVTLTLHTARSTFELPRRPARAEDESLAPFGEPFSPSSSGSTALVPRQTDTLTNEWNVRTKTLTIRSEFPYSRRRLDATGTELAMSSRWVSEIRDDDPTSARHEQHRSYWFYRPGWDVQIDSTLRLWLTREAFMLEGEVRCLDAGRTFFERKWQRTLPRDLV